MTDRPTPTFVVELQPTPAGRDEHGAGAYIRLRFILKRLLRQFGFRCVRVEERTQEATE